MNTIDDGTLAMTEDEYQQARLNNAAGVLHREISRLAQQSGLTMTRASLQRIQEWVGIHREDCRRNGIDFPEMVVVGFPLIRAVEIVRKDWSQADVEIWVVGLPAKYPDITAAEIAAAMKAAWPGYQPRSLQ